MFGYVMINKPELKIKEYERYHAYYCGLCRTLKKEYGTLGQFTLTYDMTFLIMVLTALYEEKPIHEKHHCMVHPIKKHSMLMNEITSYAAAMNIALSYHHFQDDWEDEKSIKGLSGVKLVKRRYKKIAKKYPRQVEVIRRTLKELKAMEDNNETRLDYVARPFGELMAELFVYREDEWQENLRNLGFYLGKFIYIMDAYEDLEKDVKQGNYNPFKEADHEKLPEEMEHVLTLMMAEATKAFEKLPIIVKPEVDILRNILYAGVWCKYDKMRQKCVEERNKTDDSRSI